MAWTLLMISIALFGCSAAVLNKRSYTDEQNYFSGYNYRGYGHHPPPPPHPHPHNPFHHHHHPGPPPPHNPFNPQFNREPAHIVMNPSNPFLPLNPFLPISSSGAPGYPGIPNFSQGIRFPYMPKFPQLPGFPQGPEGFPQLQVFGNGFYNPNSEEQPQSQPEPQSQPKSPTDGLISGTFGGITEKPQVNNDNASTKGPHGQDDLIQSIFPGLGPDGKPKTQPQPQPQAKSPTDGLISGTFGGFTEKPQVNNDNASTKGLRGQDDLIQSIFPGLGPDGKPKTEQQPQPQPKKPTDDLITNIFAGFTDKPQVNADGPTTITPSVGGNAEIKATGNNQSREELIQSIFNPKENKNEPNAIGTSAIPPSTTNSEGLIYDIDVRSL